MTMNSDSLSTVRRRDFLKLAGATTILGFSHSALAAAGGRVSILVDGSDPIASSAPVKRAVERLSKALAAKGVNCSMAQSADEAKSSTSCIIVAGGRACAVWRQSQSCLAFGRGDRRVARESNSLHQPLLLQ